MKTGRNKPGNVVRAKLKSKAELRNDGLNLSKIDVETLLDWYWFCRGLVSIFLLSSVHVYRFFAIGGYHQWALVDIFQCIMSLTWRMRAELRFGLTCCYNNAQPYNMHLRRERQFIEFLWWKHSSCGVITDVLRTRFKYLVVSGLRRKINISIIFSAISMFCSSLQYLVL